MTDCDLAIVGAGPVGCIAAIKAAEKGLKVIVIDRKKEIGVPKQCAEGTTIKPLIEMGIDIDDRWVCKKFDKAMLWGPIGECIQFDLKGREKITIDRKLFEKSLSAKASKLGVKFLLKHDAIDFQKKGEIVSGVKVKKQGRSGENDGKESIVQCHSVILAEGVCCRLTWALTGQRDSLIDTISCFQYELEGLDMSGELELFFDSKIAPGGYAWIFPKSDTRANVGLGVNMAHTKRNPKKWLVDFIKDRPKIFAKSKVLEINAGVVPLKPKKKMSYGNVLLAGDCGGTVNPLHGGGIEVGMRSGILAAEIISQELEEIKIGHLNGLKDYDKKWDKLNGKRLHSLYRFRDFFYHLSDDDVTRVFALFNEEEIEAFYRTDNLGRMKMIGKRAPFLMKLALKYLANKAL